MQENNSGNNLSSSQINKPLEDYYLNKNGYNDSPHGDDNARKKKIIAGVVAVAVVIAIVIIIAVSLGNSMNGIEIVGEQLVTDPYYTTIGDYLYPIVVVKVKNTSNTTKKVSFEANFYADGNACPRRRSLSARPERQRLPHVVLSRILLQDHQVARLLLTLRKSVIIIFL